jgi:glucose/arabinose dehydrogenase
MRRAAKVAALIATSLLVVGVIACAPLSAVPAFKPAAQPPASASGQPGHTAPPPAAQPTASTWQDTNLPSSAAPGASTDDSADERHDGEKSNPRTRLSVDPAVPRRVQTSSAVVPPEGLEQTVVVSGLMLPVAFEFAPDGRQIFVNELYGKVRLVDDGQLLPEPVVVLPTTQGLEQGALGLALDTAFARNRWFYVLYSQVREGMNAPRRNRIVRFTEHNGRGTEETIILDNLPVGIPGPENLNGDHNGGRIGFGPDGKLYVTVGDAGKRSEVRKPRSLHGKLLRINADGSTPEDNPDPDSRVLATGFRSPFGLDFQPGTGLPWVSDNGPQGHDEINRVVAGGNYGWPEEAGLINGGLTNLIGPVWESTIDRYGPTGVAFYTGTAVPEWRNDIFFCEWNSGSLWRLNLQAPTYDTFGALEPITQPCRLYVRNGPDGALYFSDHHAIYRLGPPR